MEVRLRAGGLLAGVRGLSVSSPMQTLAACISTTASHFHAGWLTEHGELNGPFNRCPGLGSARDFQG